MPPYLKGSLGDGVFFAGTLPTSHQSQGSTGHGKEESISAQVISTLCPALPHAPPGPLNKEGEGLA